MTGPSLENQPWLHQAGCDECGDRAGVRAAKRPPVVMFEGWRRANVMACLVLALLASLISTRSDAAGEPPVFVYSNTDRSRFHVDFQWGAQAVSHSSLNFYPKAVSASIGVWVFDNIGIHVHLDRGVATDSASGFSVEIDNASGIGLRFQSPPRRGLSAYVDLGFVDYQVKQTESGDLGSRTVTQGFSGVRFSLGVAQRLAIYKHLLLTGEYRNYYADDEIQVDSLLIGLRINLQ